MGSKSGGGGRTPYYAPNTLHSKQRSKIAHLLGAGPFAGWKEGNEDPFRSIYFNDTPVKNKDGSFNFNGVKINWLDGSGDQNYLVGFDTVEKSVPVGARVRKGYPVTQTITNPEITSLRVTIGTDVLYKQHDNGDVTKTRVAMRVEIVKNNKVHTQKTWDVEEKSSAVFYQDLDFADLPDVPFSIRCVRDMADSTSDKLRNNTFFYSYVEQVGAKFSYPHCAMVGLEFDAEQFGTSMPTMTFAVEGRIIQVPSNYDPVARTYKGLWDGLFKPAFSNNPAWVMYDICTDEVDGFGRQLKGFVVDKAKLYEIGRYCDELVDDGEGGKEPRFIFNGVIQGNDAYIVLNNVASVFCGMPVWLGDRLSFVYDRSGLGPVKEYTNANTVDGLFTYSHTPLSSIINSVQYEYADENDGCRLKVEELSNDKSIAKYRRLNVDKITVYGATKRSYAVRRAKWHLETAQTENEAVTFTIGREGLAHEPYDIIAIADNDFAGENIGGRILSIKGKVVQFDRPLKAPIKVSIFCQDGASHEFAVVKQLATDTYELEGSPDALQYAVFTAWLDNVSPRLFKAISIQENTAEGSYTIGAVKYNRNKGNVVDNAANIGNETGTTYNPVPQLNNPSTANDGDSIILSWGSLAVTGEDVTYQINLFKDGKLYRSFNQKETELRLRNLPQGEYVARIRAKAGNGLYSDELVIAFSTTYNIDALRTKPILWGVQVNWAVPPLLTSNAHTEIWYGLENDIVKASLLAKVAYPQTEFVLTDLSIGESFYFWARLVDAKDNRGEFTASVKGQPSEDASSMLEYLDGQITNTQLGKDLIEQIQSGGQAGEDAKEALAAVAKEARDRAAAIAIETRDRNAAIAKETTARLADIKKLDDGLTQEITSRKEGDGNLQRQVTTIKSSTDTNTAAIQTEITARTTADTALGKRIDTVVADNGKNSAAITAEASARASADGALGKRIDSVQATAGNNTAAITSETTARVDADKALGQRIDTTNATVGKNSASIGRIDKTVADNQSATAEKLDILEASFAGANMLDNSDFKDDWVGWGFGGTGSSYATSGFNLRNAVYTYELPSSKVFWARTFKNKMNYILTPRDADNSVSLTAVTEGQVLQISAYVSGWGLTGGTRVYLGLKDANGDEVTGVTAIQNSKNSRSPYPVASEGRGRNPADNSYSQLDRFTRIWCNVIIPKGVSFVAPVFYSYMNNDAIEGFTFIACPMLCEVKSLDAEPPVYSSGTSAASLAEAFRQVEVVSKESSATAKEVSSLSATVGKNTASITSLTKVVADNQKSTTEQITTAKSEWQESITVQDTRNDDQPPSWYYANYPRRVVNELKKAKLLGLASSGYADLETVVSWRDSSGGDIVQNGSVAGVNKSRSGGAKGKPDVWSDWVEAESTTGAQSKADEALRKSSADLTSFKQTQAAADSALSKRIDTTNVAVGKNTAGVTQQSTALADLNGKLSAQYSLKVEAIAGGKKAVAGMAIGVDGATGESQFIVMADKFAVYGSDLKPVFVSAGGKTGFNGDLIVDGSILGKHIRANQTISAPIITGGTITGNTINGATINGGVIKGGSANFGNGNCTISSSGDFYAKNGRFEGTVYANSIEGDVLKVEIFQAGNNKITINAPSVKRARNLIISNFRHKLDFGKWVSTKYRIIVRVNGSITYTGPDQTYASPDDIYRTQDVIAPIPSGAAARIEIFIQYDWHNNTKVEYAIKRDTIQFALIG